jgi:hypothetical protein
MQHCRVGSDQLVNFMHSEGDDAAVNSLVIRYRRQQGLFRCATRC